MRDSRSGRKRRSTWRRGVWVVLVGCVALIAYLLVQGLLDSAGPLLKLEGFAVLFVVGCVLLVIYSRSGKKKPKDSE
jgi:hypothetical protein